MSAAEETELTPAEMSALLKALVKLVGPEKLAKLAQPQQAVVRPPTEPTAEDFAELRSIRRKRGQRHG